MTVPLACPHCRAPLTTDGVGLGCDGCGRRFGAVGGIPDLRVFADPYLTVEEDRQRSEMVMAALERMELPHLLEHYWSVSDVTPPELRRRFVAGALRGDGKAERLLALLHRHAPVGPGTRLLDVGSGTGAILAAATARGATAVGIDIAMRWLHVSRRRFRDLGRAEATLVGACAERLPFPDGSFDHITCVATLEFLRDPRAFLAEAARVLDADGTLIVNTTNRFSLASDPFVALWGVGLLPRQLQAPYVRLRRKASYENIRRRSRRELAAWTRPLFGEMLLEPADTDDGTLGDLPPRRRRLVRAYRAVRRNPVGASILREVGPEWDLLLQAPRPAAVNAP